MSLNDWFGALEIDEDEPKKPRWCASHEYNVAFHKKAWFMDIPEGMTIVEPREVEYNRAMYLYYIGDYYKALECMRKWREMSDHKGFFLVQVADSMLRAALRVPSSNSSLLLSILSELDSVSVNYGDQLALWTAQKSVYASILGYSSEFLTAVIMLVRSISIPEHWLYFAEKKDLMVGPNFRLAYITRALLIIENHLDMNMAAGFVKAKLQRDKIKLQQLLEEYPEEVRMTARKEMALGQISENNPKHDDDDLNRPAHECRSKVGLFKTPEMCKKMEFEFRARFRWMLVGM